MPWTREEADVKDAIGSAYHNLRDSRVPQGEANRLIQRWAWDAMDACEDSRHEAHDG